MEQRYKAFISYRHNDRDRNVAEKLQKKLESYKPPKGIGEQGKKREKWRVFRDETELTTAHNLSDEIKKAIEESEYLIVVCSEEYKESRWCMEEVRHFKALHQGRNDKIITVLSSGDPDTVFPAELLTETVMVIDENGKETMEERTVVPLAANVCGANVKEQNKKLETEFLRVAAPLLGSDYDKLYQRWHRSKTEKILAIGGVILAVLLAFSIVSGTMLWKISNQQKEIVRQTEIAIQNEQVAIANQERAEENEEIAKANEERAEQNAKEAESNAKQAEENAQTAKKNEAKANASAKEAKENAARADKNAQEAELNAKTAEKNADEARKNAETAEKNAEEARLNAEAAEKNAEEARQNAETAEKNAEEARLNAETADKNAKEADKQRLSAEENAREADRQRQTAEQNEQIAKENEEKANESNRNLKIKNAEILSTQAENYLKDGDRAGAVMAAKEAVLQADSVSSSATITGQRVLSEAMALYTGGNQDMEICVPIPSQPEKMLMSPDGRRLLVQDKGKDVHLISMENAKILRSYRMYETFGDDEMIIDIAVDETQGYILVEDTLLALQLETGEELWRHTTDGAYSHSFEGIAVSETGDYLLLGYYKGYTMLEKNGSVIRTAETEVAFYRFTDTCYIDEQGTGYLQEDKNVYATTETAQPLVPLVTFEEGEVFYDLSFDEQNVYISYTKGPDSYNSRVHVACLKKDDYSLLWDTELGDMGYATYRLLSPFLYMYYDENKVVNRKNTVLSIVGENISVLDKETGEILKWNVLDSEPVFCYNQNGNGVLYLMMEDRLLSYYVSLNSAEMIFQYHEDTVKGACTFNSGAIAVEDASQIRLMHTLDGAKGTVLTQMPAFSIYNPVGNENGIISAYGYAKENNETAYQYVIYDTNTDRLLASWKETDTFRHVVLTEKYFCGLTKEGNLRVLDFSGNLEKEINLKELFVANGLCREEDYFYVQNIFPQGNRLICVATKAVISLDPETEETTMLLKNGSLYDTMYANGVFLGLEKSMAGETIRYVLPEQERSGVVASMEPGKLMPKNSVVKMTAHGETEKIAYISLEGYIGIYSCRDGSLVKYETAGKNQTPKDMLFTNSGNALMVLLADGTILKLDAETAECLIETKTAVTIDSTTKMTLLGENVAIKEGLNQAVYDTKYVKRIATVCGSTVLPDGKILYNGYDQGSYIGYYQILTQEELLAEADAFLDKYLIE